MKGVVFFSNTADPSAHHHDGFDWCENNGYSILQTTMDILDIQNTFLKST